MVYCVWKREKKVKGLLSVMLKYADSNVFVVVL